MAGSRSTCLPHALALIHQRRACILEAALLHSCTSLELTLPIPRATSPITLSLHHLALSPSRILSLHTMVKTLDSYDAFKAATSTDKLVVIDFWATWCASPSLAPLSPPLTYCPSHSLRPPAGAVLGALPSLQLRDHCGKFADNRVRSQQGHRPRL